MNKLPISSIGLVAVLALAVLGAVLASGTTSLSDNPDPRSPGPWPPPVTERIPFPLEEPTEIGSVVYPVGVYFSGLITEFPPGSAVDPRLRDIRLIRLGDSWIAFDRNDSRRPIVDGRAGPYVLPEHIPAFIDIVGQLSVQDRRYDKEYAAILAQLHDPGHFVPRPPLSVGFPLDKETYLEGPRGKVILFPEGTTFNSMGDGSARSIIIGSSQVCVDWETGTPAAEELCPPAASFSAPVSPRDPPNFEILLDRLKQAFPESADLYDSLIGR